MKRTYQENKSLYESIMRDVAKVVKSRLVNEELDTDDSSFNEYVEYYKKWINEYINDIIKYAVEFDEEIRSLGNEKTRTLGYVFKILEELREFIQCIQADEKYSAENNLNRIVLFIQEENEKL